MEKSSDKNNKSTDKFLNNMQKLVNQVASEIRLEQEEYFKLLKECNKYTKYTLEVGNHILDFEISDQIKIMNINIQLGKLAKELNEKYNFVDIDGEEDLYE